MPVQINVLLLLLKTNKYLENYYFSCLYIARLTYNDSIQMYRIRL